MRREHLMYLGFPLAGALLFWNSLISAALIAGGLLYLLHSRGLFRLLRKAFRSALSSPAASESQSASPADPGENSEPTLITLVANSPHELLGIHEEAGTSTIFHSFYDRMKSERNDNLRLNKRGRRLAAAKNAMMARRRKYKQGKADLETSLAAFLATRPAYAGEVVHYKNLPPSALGKYEVGMEIEGLGLTTKADARDCKGRGSHRFLIRCRNGRLLSDAGEGQVAFLPGTRFVIRSRSPWKNPDYPETPEGYTFELEEVA